MNKPMKKRKVPIELVVFGAIIIFIAAASVIFSSVQVPASNAGKASLPNQGKAPELAGISGWINSEPLKISELKGRVVLVDFWTYSCINCIRTLPYLNDWQSKYAGKGLVIIGVHTPEFEFEKDYNNVKMAVEKYGIKYAVAQDNDYATWRAFGNKYWPRKYLIDKEGNIRYDHIGEGSYNETENAIRELLEETDAKLDVNMSKISSATDFSKIGTPEIYLGYTFAREQLGNPEGFSPGNAVNYASPNITRQNIVYLQGPWRNEADRIVAEGDAAVFLAYTAKDVNIVAGGTGEIAVYIDGEALQQAYYGRDSAGGKAKIDSQRLYNVVSTPGYGTHLLEIRAGKGFELYTFTFG